MALRPTVLLVPSRAPDPAALRELPRRLATSHGALAALYPFRILGLARALAEPALLGRDLGAWDSGHGARLAARLLDGPHGLRLDADLPRGPVARALARTLRELRLAGVGPGPLETLAAAVVGAEDAARLRALAGICRAYTEAVDGRFADPASLLRVAAERVAATGWLREADVLLLDDGELEPLEEAFLAALARHRPVTRLVRPLPPGLRPGSFAERAGALGLREQDPRDTLVAPLVPATLPAGLARLRAGLFEPPSGEPPLRDGSVELVTAPGEAAEVRALVRRMLAAAADGMPFEEMGVVLPRPDAYASLFSDLFERLGVPFRLHPSLPLRHGRAARALLLLLRCRGLERRAVVEFLTFAPVPFARLLGPEAPASSARFDQLSRDARIVSGYERWLVGLRAFAEAEREAAELEGEPARRERRLHRVAEAEALLRLVELLNAALDGLAGLAPWAEWSARLRQVFRDWVACGDEGEEQRRVDEVLAELAGLGALGPSEASTPWPEVEAVVEARFELERLPLEREPRGGVHVGALDAMAGLPFRLLLVPGLVEGGYPGVLRPDPFLLDAEREALNAWLARPVPTPDTGAARTAARGTRTARSDGRQLSLFAEAPAAEAAPGSQPAVSSAEPGAQPAVSSAEPGAQPAVSSAEPGAQPAVSGAEPGSRLPTTQDRLLEARRLFHRALSQATERLVLSYPRADPRSGRERLPSLFFVAAASTLAGLPLDASGLERMVVEDALETLPLERALDRGERDRVRLLRGGEEAAQAVASGSSFFRQSRLATNARWDNRLTAYDGLVAPLPEALAGRLDPVEAPFPVSASRLATYVRCGFLYLLQNVLRLEPTLEPEERRRLDPLERGSAFHEVAERFLRERRERGELPVADTPEARERLLEMGEQRLAALVAGQPPRFTLLWERERKRFRETLLAWLQREADQAGRATPAHFEVGFGLPRPGPADEPHRERPITIDLGDGRILRVSGKIDRIDRRPDGGLVLRDYKTGRAPRDDGTLFKGGKQLQIPFYVRAAEELFPGETVREAFLDYVDGGRRVALDPAWARGERFVEMLRALVRTVASGVFLQEPSACEWCDFTEVCGPRGLIERRRRYKTRDRAVQQVLRLRDLG